MVLLEELMFKLCFSLGDENYRMLWACRSTWWVLFHTVCAEVLDAGIHCSASQLPFLILFCSGGFNSPVTANCSTMM